MLLMNHDVPTVKVCSLQVREDSSIGTLSTSCLLIHINQSAPRMSSSSHNQPYTEVLSTLLATTSRPFPLFSLPTSPRPLRFPSLSHSITSLTLHPCLESACHLLNLDLPAAHFLLRHMQDPSVHPEAALLHAILHRIEGDIENARAWYGSTLEAVGGERNGDEYDGAGQDSARDVLEAAWPLSSSFASSLVPGNLTRPNAEHAGTTTPALTAAKTSAHTRALAFLDAAASLRDISGGSSGSKVRSSQDKRGEEVAQLANESLEEISRVLRWCEEKYGTAAVGDATKVWTRMAEEHRSMAEGMIVGGEGWREF